MKGFAGLYLVVTELVWAMLAVNALNVVTSLPVVLVLLGTDLSRSWLLLAILSPLVGLSFAATCAVFGGLASGSPRGVVRTYLTGWVRAVRRVTPVAVGVAAFAVVLGVDVAATALWGVGPVGLASAAVLTVVSVPVLAVAWVGLVERPDLSRVDVLKVSVYLAVRRGGWSLASLAALVVAGTAVTTSPVLGLGLVLAPVLYVVWGNSRRALAELVRDVVPSDLVDETTAFGRA